MAEEEMKSGAARMTTIACVLVGVEGMAFTVDIDVDRSLSHLKDVIKEKNPQSIQCEARGLKLALARRKNSRDDPWLHSDEPIVMEMQSGAIPSEVKELFKEQFKDPIKTIRDVFGDDIPTTERVHLLVKLPAYKRQIPPVAISWTATTGAFPSLTFNDSHFIRIPERYVRGSGVGTKGEDLLLYRRPQLIEELVALQCYVIDAPSLLWIMGPPGTGKSCAAFAFACSLDRSEGVDVLWIHCPKVPGVSLRSIRFSRLGDKHTSSVEADEIHAVLLSLKKTAIVFLDGYAANSTKDADSVLEVCAKWRNKNKACHRLVCVCLMVSSGRSWHQECYEFISMSDMRTLATSTFSPGTQNVPDTLSPVRDQTQFRLASWTLEDYKATLENDVFFDKVKTKFTDSEKILSRKERMLLLEEKYSVVGGNARLMFDLSTEEATMVLCQILDNVDDMRKYIDGTVGVTAAGGVNRLFSWYPERGSTSLVAALLSKCVARQLVLRLEPQYFQRIATLFARNPGMDGHVYELWFFAKLTADGVRCYSVNHEQKLWQAQSVTVLHSRGNIPLHESPQWMAPAKSNAGGYDAVRVEVSKFEQAGYTQKVAIRFVQVTRSTKPSFSHEDFSSLLIRLGSTLSNAWFEKIDVYFVVPNHSLSTRGFILVVQRVRCTDSP